MSAAESNAIDTTPTSEDSDTMPSRSVSPQHVESASNTDVVMEHPTFPTEHGNHNSEMILTRHDTEYTEFTQTSVASQSTVSMASVRSATDFSF
jgi:hypothetical protein